MNEFEFGIILTIDKAFFGYVNDCIYCALYVPPLQSPFYQEQNKSALKCLEDILTQSNLIGRSMILVGDFNSRTGTNLDYIEGGNCDVPELYEFNDILYDNVAPRHSCDAVINVSGKELLHFCKSYNFIIINGRFGDDKGIGKFTFLNQNGCSVIDYYIVSKSFMNLVENFIVHDMPDSSHLPISIEIKNHNTIPNVDNDEKLSPVLFSYEWNDTNSTKYCENIYKHFLDGKFEEIDCLIDNEDVNVNTILEAFENILKLCSEDVKRTRRTLRKTNCKKWFDIECKHAKRKTIKSLRKFRASRSVENLNK